MPDWLTVTAVVAGMAALLAAGRWVGGVNNDRRSFHDFVKEMREKFMPEIRQDIKMILQRLPRVPVAGGSPIRLTSYGRDIAAWLEAEEWAEGLAPQLSAQVAGKKPFEIDEFAHDYVRQRLPEEWEEKVAAGAYRFGTDREGVKSVLRVVLRDRLLQQAGHSVPEDSPD